MPSPFTPPAGNAFAKVDIAEGVQYDGGCIVVEGVVAPRGQGGWPGHADGYVHSFSFAAWRVPGKPLVTRKLTLLWLVPRSEQGSQWQENIFNQFPSYSVQRLNVLLSKDQMRAVVEKVLPLDKADRELISFSERLRQPVVISTKQFGDLVMNPTIGWFEGKRKWNGKLIAVTFEKGDDDGIDDAVKTADSLWSDQAGWKRRVDDYAVERLLEIKNDSWLGKDEAELTAKAFKSRMKLVSITVGGNGRFTFWHDDGDLFWGHSIEVRGNLKDGFIDAGIAG